jgi:hypothetical protein
MVARQVGRRLALARQAARKTQEDAEAAGIGKRTKVWQHETGRRLPDIPDLRAYGLLYGLSNAEVDILIRLRNSATSGVTEVYAENVIPEWFGLYVGLEAQASRIGIWRADGIPGLLQTEGYARTMISADRRLDPEIIEQRVRVRLERQRAVLDRPAPPNLSVVLDAAVLRRGAPDRVLREQADYLRVRAASAHITVRVLPLEAYVDRPSGPFTLLRFDDAADPEIAYVEHALGARYLTKNAQLRELHYLLEQVRSASIMLEGTE